MSSISTIAISPLGFISKESELINQLFDGGLHRYHIHKYGASEQALAEILEGVQPKYLSNITLHSHFHLVLAYGVGGIHYSQTHRTSLGVDYPAKVKLYQGFGIKVSTDADDKKLPYADYGISSELSKNLKEKKLLFTLTSDIQRIKYESSAIVLDNVLADQSIKEIVGILALTDPKP